MIDDNEQAKSYGVLSYRLDQNRYLIDQIIFDGSMKDYRVEIGHQRFDRHTTPQQLKKIRADITQNDDNDVVEDQVMSKKYPVTQTLILRYFDSHDLNYFYFNNNKLISIQYVVQC